MNEMTPIAEVKSELRSMDFAAIKALAQARRSRRNANRRERDQAMRDLGMVRVRGNLGGTFWE